MSEQRPVPPDTATSEAAALRQTGASPLHRGEPARIGPYVPLALLGSGGMGRVYLARSTDDSPDLVAVKVIRPEYADDSNFRRRFEREASVHAQVRTPHTPRLCGTGFEDALLWMATEYLPGLDLADAVREDGALEPGAVWRLVGELGRALADLGEAGIVHRDLKPSNVRLCLRGAYLIDFGLSKAVDASALTGTGIRVGTPAFMSPEHLRTGRSDTQSDVFSLAGTLVYAATGRAPFGDGSGVDVMHRVAFESPDPELITEISVADAALGSLLSACLAKEPEQRPTPRDLVEAAGARALNSGWPEPLNGKALARQRAYEVLRGLPVEQQDRLRSADAARPAPGHPERPVAVPPVTGRTNRPVPPGSVPPEEGTGPSALAPPEQSRGEEGVRAGVRAGARRKRVSAVAGGIALCAVAAGAFVLTRPDASAPPTASLPEARATIGGAAPDDASSAPMPSASEGTSAAGRSAGGAVSTAGAGVLPEASGSADAGRRTTPSSPAAEPSAPGDASTSPSDPPPEPVTPAWISDCTHYSGNGRTRQGDSGKRVLQVQCMLTKRGYGVGSTGTDGDFGPGTESAVRSFQSAKGLDADGIVGRDTWAALRATE